MKLIQRILFGAVCIGCSRTGEFVESKVLGQLVGFHRSKGFVGVVDLSSPSVIIITLILKFSSKTPTFFKKSYISLKN